MSQTLHAVFYHGNTMRLDHVASGAIANGDVVNMGNGLVGVCTDPLGIADGALGSLTVGGVWKLKHDNTSGPTFSKGDVIYWDEGNDEATAGSTAASDYAFGICVKDAGASDDYVLVLNVPGIDAMIGDDFSEIAQLTDNSGGAAADGTIGVVTLPTTMVDSTAGTADGTLEALPNPTDAPATADALRDDLVAVHWPILRNWGADVAARQAENKTAITACRDAIKELATKVNAIIAAQTA